LRLKDSIAASRIAAMLRCASARRAGVADERVDPADEHVGAADELVGAADERVGAVELRGFSCVAATRNSSCRTPVYELL
jgi:hypothetical protein